MPFFIDSKINPIDIDDKILPTVVDQCNSGHPEWCNSDTVAPTNQPKDDWISWRVHFRNFLYLTSPTATYPYADFDDVYGIIKYTFKESHLQIDYQLWRTSEISYGVGNQQLPIAFFRHFNKFTYGNNVVTRAPAYYDAMGQAFQYPKGSDWSPATLLPTDPRWVMLESVKYNPNEFSNMSGEGNFLTLGIYSWVQGPTSRICPDRQIQIQFQGDDNGVIVQSEPRRGKPRSFNGSGETYVNFS